MDPSPDSDRSVNSGGETGTLPLAHACVECRHYRYGGWQQQEKQHAEREAQVIRDRQAFSDEPHHYAWCAAFTPLALVERANDGDPAAFAELRRMRAATVHPVTGKVSAIYTLCLWKNPNGDCESYEPR